MKVGLGLAGLGPYLAIISILATSIDEVNPWSP
jgi:hypothetical protein